MLFIYRNQPSCLGRIPHSGCGANHQMLGEGHGFNTRQYFIFVGNVVSNLFTNNIIIQETYTNAHAKLYTYI